MNTSARTMKMPGPDHPIAIVPAGKTVRVIWRGAVIAETRHALKFEEAGYPPVYYIPRAGARMEIFARSEHKTWCPYKGEASYFSLTAPTGGVENAIWSYETPFDAVADIREYLAFYPGKVDRIETE